MSSTPPPSGANAAANSGKKAVHVKWAGKTIALGTFPNAEADEKCARAKALTRSWRTSMRPKPSRDWVMLELERLGVRVVSGRLGRKAGEDGEDEDDLPIGKKGPSHGLGIPGMSGAGIHLERTNSMGWGPSDAELNNLMMARRNSSLGLSMMNDARGSFALGQVLMDPTDPTMPPHRPLVGGGAAAAYEAARHDHFTQKASEQQRRASSLGLGSLGAGGALGNVGLSVTANQHYEMLKLHHMNLLNEIQETTLMMNLYQQQQLQQQQQQLQAQAQAGADIGGDHSLSMMMQGSAGTGLDMYSGQLNQRGSLGLGVGTNGLGNAQLHLMQQQALSQSNAADTDATAAKTSISGPSSTDLEGRIAQLRQDIAKSDEEATGDNKRPAEDSDDEASAKRAKTTDEAAKEKSKGSKSKNLTADV